jgi:hypothetical protein
MKPRAPKSLEAITAAGAFTEEGEEFAQPFGYQPCNSSCLIKATKQALVGSQIELSGIKVIRVPQGTTTPIEGVIGSRLGNHQVVDVIQNGNLEQWLTVGDVSDLISSSNQLVQAIRLESVQLVGASSCSAPDEG